MASGKASGFHDIMKAMHQPVLGNKSFFEIFRSFPIKMPSLEIFFLELFVFSEIFQVKMQSWKLPFLIAINLFALGALASEDLGEASWAKVG